MTFDYQLRPATMEDREFMMHLERTKIEKFSKVMELFDAEYQKHYYDTYFNPKHVSIIEYANRPIGAQSIIIRRKEIFIIYINLLPEFQNLGIDETLIQITLQRAKKERKPVITCVLKEDTQGTSMWHTRGFKTFNETELRWRVRWDPPVAA